MTKPPLYVTRLVVDRQADERDIRRAYPRELKLPDRNTPLSSW